MAVPVPAAFVDGDLAAAEMNTKVFDPLAFLFGSPWAIQRVSGIALTQSVFTSIDSWAAPEDGIYFASASVRCSNVRGNKELRVTTDGQYDDADPWIAAQNQFGVATPAFSSLAASGLVAVTAGSSIEYGVFVDTPDSCQVDNGVLTVVWICNQFGT